MTSPELVKLVITDVDGTLAAINSKDVSAANIDAIKALEQRNVHVAIASARSIEPARPIIEKCGLTGWQVVDGCATLHNYSTEETVRIQWLDVQRLVKIAQGVVRCAELIDCFPDTRMIAPSEFDISQIVDEAPYVYLKTHEKYIEQIYGHIADISNVVGSIVASEPDGICHIQIVDKAATKQHGFTALQEQIGVTPGQTLAIGDGDNDLPLFEAARIKVAMGNASDKLKQRATYVTDAVAEDGWTKAMQRYVR